MEIEELRELVDRLMMINYTVPDYAAAKRMGQTYVEAEVMANNALWDSIDYLENRLLKLEDRLGG